MVVNIDFGLWLEVNAEVNTEDGDVNGDARLFRDEERASHRLDATRPTDFISYFLFDVVWLWLFAVLCDLTSNTHRLACSTRKSRNSELRYGYMNHEHKVSRKENATNLVIVGRMVGQAIDLISIDSFDWFISAAGVRNRWKTKHYW